MRNMLTYAAREGGSLIKLPLKPASVELAGSRSTPPYKRLYAKGKFLQVDTIFLSRHKSISRATLRNLMPFFAVILRKIVSPCSPNFIIFLEGELFFYIFYLAGMCKIGENRKAHVDYEFRPHFFQSTTKQY